MTIRSFLVRVRHIATLGVFLAVVGSAQAQVAAGAPQPVTWFRADAIHGLADGAAVAAWPDSGSGKTDATQPVAAQQPAFALHAVNGYPAVHFTEAKNTQLAFPPPVQDDFTIVCVFQSAQGIGSGEGWYSGAGLVDGEVEGVHRDFGLSLSGSGQLLAGIGHSDDWNDTYIHSDGGLNDGKPHIVVLERVKSTGSVTLYTDGAPADSAVGNTLSLSDPPRLTLGSSQLNKGYFTGDIAEVQIYAAALSDAQRQATERALRTKFGIAPPLPESPPSAVPATARLNPVILPPDPRPAIHGPKIVGATPLHPFLFLIPATGADPLTYACPDLPGGLKLDTQTGIISGSVAVAGNYALHLSVSNAQGTVSRVLTLVCADHSLALTPPMGWDASNFYANQIDAEKTRNAADWLVKSGLAAHGYQYVHIGDTWQGIRDKKTGEILPNRRRFPDPKDLADYLHSQGLKFGLSSSATEHTCGGYPGSQGFVSQDAKTYAGWGVDYLEYTWCPLAAVDEGKPPGNEGAAFQEMRDALQKTDRDIVYALNTFGKDSPSDIGISAGANSWMTSQQLYDDWSLVVRDYFPGSWMFERGGPGHWNDPGLLMVGKFGVGEPRKTRLTYCEQMAQLSQSALVSAPLWLSCDLSSLDPNTFHPSTTAMLTNDEVLDVDQDPLGHAAGQIVGGRAFQIWSKPLSDGTVAVGLFNVGEGVRPMRVKLSSLGLSSPQPIRDLWLHQDLGDFTQSFTAEVPEHGVVFLKIGKPK